MEKAKILLVLAFCSFLVGLDALVVSPLIPAMAHDGNFSMSIGGLLVTSYALLYGLSAPIFGPLSDYWGRKRMVTTGMLIFAVGTLLTSLGQNFAQMIVLRMIAGIGGAMLMPSVYALVGDLVPIEQRGRAIGKITGAMGMATLFGIPFGAVIATYFSWRGTFIFVGVGAIIIYAILQKGLEEKAPKMDGGVKPLALIGSQLLKALKDKASIVALLCTLLWWASFQGLFANMGMYYATTFSLPVLFIGIVFALSGFGNWLGNSLGGRFSDRWGRKVIIVWACVVASASMMIIPQLKISLPAVVGLHFIWAVATGFGQSSLTTYISELRPEIRGTLLSLNSAATYLGMTFSTSLAAGLLKMSGFTYVGIFCGVCVLAVPILLLYLNSAGKAETASYVANGK